MGRINHGRLIKRYRSVMHLPGGGQKCTRRGNEIGKKKTQKESPLRLFSCSSAGRTLYTCTARCRERPEEPWTFIKFSRLTYTHTQAPSVRTHARTDRNRLRSGPPRKEYYTIGKKKKKKYNVDVGTYIIYVRIYICNITSVPIRIEHE